jgi:hypothetical protein
MRRHVVVVSLAVILVGGMLRSVANVVHVRRWGEGPVQVLCVGVGGPVRS